MSLMSMSLLGLGKALGPIAALMVVQVALVLVVTRWLVFRFAGRDYDAAVIAAGFAGIALGATPIGVHGHRDAHQSAQVHAPYSSGESRGRQAAPLAWPDLTLRGSAGHPPGVRLGGPSIGR
jgi:hypothetical protein